MTWLETKELREKHAGLISRAGEILKGAHAETRELNPTENENFAKLHADARSIEDEIRRIETQAAAEKSVEERLGKVEHSVSKTNDDAAKRAFDKVLRFGRGSLTAEETRALTSGTTAEGAELVPELFHSTFYKAVRDFGGVREAGPQVIRTSGGNPYPIPKIADTQSAEQLSEGSAANDSGADPDTSEITMSAYVISSKIVKVSKQLLADSAFDVQGWLVPILGERCGDLENTRLTTGSGSSQAQGVVTGASAGVTAASTTALTYNEVLGLIHSLSRKHRVGAKLMFNDAVLLALRKLVDGSGNPLWNMGNIAAAHPDTIAGYEYVVNTAMADPAAGAVPMLFGNFNKGYVIREAGSPEVVIFTEKYADSLQNGYLAYIRGDGRVLDSACIKKLTMAAS